MANKKILMEDGKYCEVLGELGSGGQGRVYKVKYEGDGKIYALKIYLKPVNDEFKKNLSDNIFKGSPSPSFIWPLMLTAPLGEKKDRIGYLMEMYGSSYSSFIKVVKGEKVQFKSKQDQILTLINLVEAFAALHAKGYSYQDLNHGGVVIDVDAAKVYICDNDNVAPFGVNLGIQGMYKFMAPEVAIKFFYPDTHSDRFSLAVLLFWILVHGHPFDGQLVTKSNVPIGAISNKLYGTNPVFIYHPTDKSNRPDNAVHMAVISGWDALPNFIQELFIKTFTSVPKEGIQRCELEKIRQGRTTDKEWLKALYKWLEMLTTCPNCNVAIVQELDKDNNYTVKTCKMCNKKLDLKLPLLILKKNDVEFARIVLENEKKILRHSIFLDNSNEVLGEILQSTRRPDLYGLKNHTKDSWKVYQDGEKNRVFAPEETVSLLPNITILFGNGLTGEVVINYLNRKEKN